MEQKGIMVITEKGCYWHWFQLSCLQGRKYHSLIYVDNDIYECNVEGCGKRFTLTKVTEDDV